MICGVVVCWHFELLPRWALAVLAARELLMLALGRYGLARGVELRINWPGGSPSAPVMGSFFFALAALRTSARCCCTSGSRWRSSRRACTCATGLRQLRAAADADAGRPIP